MRFIGYCDFSVERSFLHHIGSIKNQRVYPIIADSEEQAVAYMEDLYNAFIYQMHWFYGSKFGLSKQETIDNCSWDCATYGDALKRFGSVVYSDIRQIETEQFIDITKPQKIYERMKPSED